MRSGARWGRGSRFPEGRGRASAEELVRAFPGGGGRRKRGGPRHGTDVAVGHAQRRARGAWFAFPGGRGRRECGGTGTRFSRRGRAARAGGPAGYARGRRGAAVPGSYARGRRGGGGSGELYERAQRGGGPAGYARGRRGAAVPGDYARGRRGRRPGGWLPCRFARHFVTDRGVAVKWGLCRCGRRGAAVPGSYARGRRGAMARRVYARGRRGRRPGGWLPCRFARHFVTGRGVVVKWGLRRRSPGVVVKRGCTAVDGGARQFRGGYAIGRRGRWPGGFMQEGAEGRRFRRVYARGCRSAPSQGCCEAGLRRCGRRGAAVPGSYARGRRGVVARRVAAVPVCPPFRDRSRGSREVGAAPPIVRGCCEAGAAPLAAGGCEVGLRRCGWRGGRPVGLPAVWQAGCMGLP